MDLFSEIFKKVESILTENYPDGKKALNGICTLLQSEVPDYDWVGFYFANFDTQTLLLKNFSGPPTEHTEIPFGKGICGQVAVSNTNFVVPDVTSQENYIACSIDVKSEIVVPLFIDGKNIGQIDVDSNSPNTFDTTDEKFLEAVCQSIAKTYPKASLLL